MHMLNSHYSADSEYEKNRRENEYWNIVFEIEDLEKNTPPASSLTFEERCRLAADIRHQIRSMDLIDKMCPSQSMYESDISKFQRERKRRRLWYDLEELNHHF
jgi:hypothetical protein